MNDIQALTGAILAKARQEAAEIAGEAEREAARIRDEAEQRAGERRAAAAATYRRKAEEIERRAKIAAELELRKRVLTAKHQLIQRALAGAREALAKLPAERRIEFFAQKLADAGRHGGGTVRGAGAAAEWQAIVQKANERIAASGSPSRLNLAPEPPEGEGGFVLSGPGYTVDGSYQALLEAAEEELVPQIAVALFPKERP
ncbi:vacuolar-type H+-ATPase subunit E/Vma4 [Hydrogenispora ethanolica]|uniref:Vacuolar-type H+-ATPase subunit E/Vma4 n=1 Tax=Hydrogenispora ethanolica TaxID=1082276 RepID=A0A4R1SCB5_HYDET|nr:V-type ATP synthase subunit E family protein [Hydrogenispora ethanolica]TCL76934.1 vacuolar-type H+-ATPase subunit E/Vma4 [Hydrogenispora ethanolica]